MNYRWSKNPGFRCTNKVVPQPVVNKVTTPLMGVMINPSDTHWFSAIKIGGRFLSLHSYRSARGHLGKNILVVTFSCMTLLLRTKKNGGIPSWFARVWILPNGIVCSPKNHPPYTVPLQNGWTWVAYRRFVGYKKKGAQVQPLNSLVSVCWWNSVGSPEAFDAQSLNGSKSSDFFDGISCGDLLIS